MEKNKQKNSKQSSPLASSSVPRNCIVHIWTFLEITSWCIELPRVCKHWAQCAASAKPGSEVYRAAVCRELRQVGAAYGSTFLPAIDSGVMWNWGYPGVDRRFLSLSRGPGCPISLETKVFRESLNRVALDRTEIKLARLCSNCDRPTQNFDRVVVDVPTEMDTTWLCIQTGALENRGWVGRMQAVLCRDCLSEQAYFDRLTENGKIRNYKLPKTIKLHGVVFAISSSNKFARVRNE